MSLEVIVVVCFMHICFFKQDKLQNWKKMNRWEVRFWWEEWKSKIWSWWNIFKKPRSETLLGECKAMRIRKHNNDNILCKHYYVTLIMKIHQTNITNLNFSQVVFVFCVWRFVLIARCFVLFFLCLIFFIFYDCADHISVFPWN